MLYSHSILGSFIAIYYNSNTCYIKYLGVLHDYIWPSIHIIIYQNKKIITGLLYRCLHDYVTCSRKRDFSSICTVYLLFFFAWIDSSILPSIMVQDSSKHLNHKWSYDHFYALRKNIVVETGTAKLMYSMNACNYVCVLVICDCYHTILACRHRGPILPSTIGKFTK